MTGWAVLEALGVGAFTPLIAATGLLLALDQRSTAQPVSGSPAERVALSEARSV